MAMFSYFNPINVNSVSVKSLNVFYVFVDCVLLFMPEDKNCLLVVVDWKL